MRRLSTVLTLLICSVAVLSGCGSDEPSTSAEPEETSSPAEPEETSAEPEETSKPAEPEETATIEITISNGSVSPSGERVEVDAGQPIELIVRADEAGAIHVHSTPEQEFEYGNGTTTLQLTPIERPGVVEVETHHPQAVVVQLEVS
jgi:hypothetical protein